MSRDVRYNTDIPTEYTYKYRTKKPSGEGDFYYGKDSDMLYKTWAAMKRGAAVGMMTGLTMSTYPLKGESGVSFGSAVQKFFKHGMPPLVAATTFGATMSLAANIRHKEDAVNHVIGGYAAGTVLGAWYKNARAGFWSGVFLALLAGGLKKFSEAGVFESHIHIRRERIFDSYRTGWGVSRPHQEGSDYQKE